MAPQAKEKKLKPVLIIPGIMSSGMAIKKSPYKSWEGKRIWLNIAQMGFQSLHVGGALRKNEKIRASHPEKSTKESDAQHLQYMQEMECKSRWVRHMRLKDDMISEKDGIEVRPIPGCAGVDYLAPGALTESQSYVFGPVLKLLKSHGYVEGINLDAAPYDWRLPPRILQERDNYFTETMDKITHLYRQSNNSPVIILCHSMGCKTGHYLFNFVRQHLGESKGQKWIDKYIEMYVPVGAPHIGSPKSVRVVMDGDTMGLDAFLDHDEGVVLGRSLGSAPWLFPLDRTKSTPISPVIPPSILRHQSSIILTIPTQTIPMKSFVYRRESKPLKVRLAIHLAKDFVVRTEFYPLSRGKSPMLTINEEVWALAVPPTLDETLKFYPSIIVDLEELGAGKPRKQRRGVCNQCDILWPCRFAFCLVKWTLCFPCAVLLKIFRLFARGAKKGADLAAAAVGETRTIGKSKPVKSWANALRESENTVSNDGGESGGIDKEVRFSILPTDREGQGFFFEIPESQECVLHVKWKPYMSSMEKKPFDAVRYKSTNVYQYYPCQTGDLLASEGLNNATKLLRNTYAADPVDPRGLSSWNPPPVQKVTAIYGINVPTEVSGVYQQNKCVKLSCLTKKDMCVKQLHVLDKSATLKGLDGYSNEGGIIRETKNTTQPIIGSDGNFKTAKISGDGTVPYWSLSHVKTWQGKGVKKCEVTVHEIDGVEHRAVLNEAKFHKILLDVIGCS